MFLATISADMSCKLWCLFDEKLVLQHTIIPTHEPVSLTWSPLIAKDGTLLLAVGTSYGTVNLWKVKFLYWCKNILISPTFRFLAIKT